MRFEAKKKPLSSGVSIVQSLTSALALVADDAEKQIRIIASEKNLRLRTQSGNQFVEAVVSEVIVQEPGEALVEMAALSSALAVSGDTIKIVKEGDWLNFACGRAKGRLQAKEVDSEEENDPPKANIKVPNLRALLKAISLKAVAGKSDRTLHFDAKAGTVCGEATDSYRAVTATANLGEGSKITEEHSLCLPHKAIDAVANLVTSDAVVGYDATFFRVKAPGFSVCMPQSSSEGILTLAKSIGEILEQQKKFATYEVLVSDMKTGLADALSLASTRDGGRVSVEFSGKGGKFIGDGEQGEVEVDFDMKGDALSLKTLIVPSFLRECLDFYRSTDVISCTLYERYLVLNIKSTDENGLASQTTAIPLLVPIPVGGEKAGSKPAKKAKPAEDDEDDATPAPAPKAAPKPVKAKPKPVEAEAEEEAPAPKVAASKQKPAPVVEEKAADEDEDEETFDDEDE